MNLHMGPTQLMMSVTLGLFLLFLLARLYLALHRFGRCARRVVARAEIRGLMGAPVATYGASRHEGWDD